MKKLKFTLIEVTVAMAVLAILMMLLMRFFTTAQNAWVTGEKRGTAYSDSRTFFDLLDSAFKSSKKDGWTLNGKYVQFSGIMPYGNSANRSRIIVDKILVGHFFIDMNDAYTTNEDVYYNGNAGLTDSDDIKNIQSIIDNVISIDFAYENEKRAVIGMGNDKDRPAFVVVTLKMFGNHTDFIRWTEINKDDEEKAEEFFNRNGYRFVRTFALPKN